MKPVIEEPHIVKEFTIGNTRIKIADNYCAGKTKKEVEAILQRIAIIVQDYFCLQDDTNSDESA